MRAAVARATAATWTAARSYGHGGGRGYSAGTEKRREGNGAGAHGGLDGVVGELGDALETVGPRRRSPAAGVEDDGDGGAPGRSGLRGSAEGFSARRRSSGTRRRCEGMAGSAGQRTAATGAFGRRGRERERAGERRRREGVRPGGVVASSRRPRRRGRGGQAGSCRGAHARGVRRPRALSLWREEGDDWRWPVSWAGLLGRARPHSARPQVSSLFLFLFLF